MTAQPFRHSAGGLVDRGRTLSFTFDGRALAGHPGDTLASALLANGVRLVGRSFKYHRPRGIMTAGSEEPNALVELRSGARREPNTRATTVELFEGLLAASQNRWPTLEHDVLSVNSALAPLFRAGFYYKTFMWPPAAWERVYEPLIRRVAGLGRAAGGPDPDTYEKIHAHADVLVIGGGPAGLIAALAAGRAGLRVILADEDMRMGGRLLAERLEADGAPGAAWAGAVLDELAALPEVRLLPRTTVFGVYDGGMYGALERVADHLPAPPPHLPRQRYWKIVARHAILAAGAIERPVVFGGNDLPGVMLAAAVRTYLNRFAVAPGRRMVVFTDNDDGWKTVADARAAGVEVAAVVESRAEVEPALAATAGGMRVLANARVVGVRGGRRGLEAVEVSVGGGPAERVGADLLAVSGGWNPTVALTCHLGGRPVFDPAIAAFVPGALPPGMTVAGAAAGTLGLGDILRDGLEAGQRAAEVFGRAAPAVRVPGTSEDRKELRRLWWVRESKGKAFVDFQNDVTVDDVLLAEREGYRAVEHLKRYTTLGMATDQGKTANVNGLAVVAELTGRPIPEVGTTTFRPPYTPVAVGTLAGHHRGQDFRPTRHTPSHAWAVERGAAFVDVGLWLRAQYFPEPGEAGWCETVDREVKAVRGGVGFCDVSTLGKIDVQGSDAGVFLDRVYANSFSNLPVGKAGYGVMLREDGFVLEDGTAAKLRDGHFYVTTTTANAARVMQHLEFCRQVLWPGLDVQLASVSEQWAQFAVAGPNARRLVERVADLGQDLSNTAFPFLAAGPFSCCGGIKGRLFRLSFSGELAYEIAVPARFGDVLPRALMEAGAELGVVPYGTEAMGVMRIEKGHLAGAELNGQTTAFDLGLGRMLSARKDFVGRAMANRAALLDPDRPRFVGLLPVDPAAQVRAGAHILPAGADATAANDQGHVTSAAFSPTLGRWIALGLVRRGPERVGERVRAHDPVRRGADVEVEITSPVFYDPKGERLRG